MGIDVLLGPSSIGFELTDNEVGDIWLADGKGSRFWSKGTKNDVDHLNDVAKTAEGNRGVYSWRPNVHITEH